MTAPYATALLALLALAGSATSDDGPIRELHIPERAGTRAEHFVLRAGGEEVGVARRLRVEGDPGELLLDVETRLFPIGTVVRHVERSGADGPSLVWREVRPGDGRTIHLEWDARRRVLATLERCGDDAPRRGELEDRALFPSWLVERLREGRVGAAPVSVYEPLAAAASERRVEARALVVGGALLRRYDLVREERLAETLVFAGGELLLHRTGPDAPVAVRVDEAGYGTVLARGAN